jgi:hypothetical protein
MAGERRRPGLSNVVLFARLECHMIARLDTLLDNLTCQSFEQGLVSFLKCGGPGGPLEQ